MLSLKDAGDVVIEPLGLAAAVDLAVGVAVAEGDLALVLEPLQRLGVGEVVALAMRDRRRRSPGPLRSGW